MTIYLEHFGLREAPFRITPHTDFFFAGANRGAVLEALVYAVTAGEGLVKVTGEVGSGKTMLSRMLIERLPPSVETIYLAVPSLSRDELLASIAVDLGIETQGMGIHQLVRALHQKLLAIHCEGRRMVALVDEAHAMPPAALEEMRLLSNLETGREKLLQVVLFGQPELDEHLALPQMRQLKERITHSFTLGPLSPAEVRAYLEFRLRAAGYRGPSLFGDDALRVIVEASEGLSRRINIFADKTLLAAFAAGTHTITRAHAEAAISDSRVGMPPRPAHRRTIALAAAGGIAAGVALGFAGSALWGSFRAAPPAPTVAAEAANPRIIPAAATAPAAAGPRPALTGAAEAPAAETPRPAALEPARAADVSGAEADAARGVEMAASVAEADKPAVASAPRSVEDALEAGRGKLARPGNRYAVQLMATEADAHAYVSGYLAEAGRMLPAQDLYLVRLAGGAAPRVGLLYGDFADRQQAFAALRELPEPLRQFKPYVRAFDAIREESARDRTR